MSDLNAGADTPAVPAEHPRLVQLYQSLTNIKPGPEQQARIETLRSSAKAFAEDLLLLTKGNREQSLAITHLEETVMWAVKSIVLETVRGGS